MNVRVWERKKLKEKKEEISQRFNEIKIKLAKMNQKTKK